MMQPCTRRGRRRRRRTTIALLLGLVSQQARVASPLSATRPSSHSVPKQHKQTPASPRRAEKNNNDAARVVVVGGGASGTFAAIAAKRAAPRADVVLVESGATGLRKVLASGGGRCNVMHAFEDGQDGDDLRRFLELHYPRGRRELRGPMAARFGPREARRFFEDDLGVALKTEADGRVFPTTDDSRTIADALERAAHDAGVQTLYSWPVAGVRQSGCCPEHARSFVVARSNGNDVIEADAVVLATGSAKAGYAMARALGADVAPPYPSLFSFRTIRSEKHAAILDARLAGVVVKDATVALEGLDQSPSKKIAPQRGPLLVTHRGVSGPAALKLSAFAAEALRDSEYRGALVVNLVPGVDDVRAALQRYRRDHAAGVVANDKKRPFADRLPARLWAALARVVVGDDTIRWGDLDNKQLGALAIACSALRVPFAGRDANKDEFVTAGGVRLNQLDPKTMQAKRLPGLFFCGELLDIDAVTGGFNFQACWTTGHLAGTGAAQHALLAAAAAASSPQDPPTLDSIT